MKIDLHGKTHPEGLELIEEYMLLNSVKGSVSLQVITGNSPVMQKKIINQICKKYGFSYYLPSHNPGEIFIQYEKL
ncbi:MAG: hypothetical protein P8M27_03755 [Flavobacteriaceae bacterium]|jgi:hypothetical protein|nr:hypothetical protein [Flavobacteriaceae bacterium]